MQIYDGANDELVFLAIGAQDGKCDKVKRVLNLMQRNKLGVRGFERCSKNRLREALMLFIAVDHARAFVTMGEVAQFWKVHKIVLPSLSNETYACACVVQGKDFLTLFPRRAGIAKAFRGYVKNSEREMRRAIDGGGPDRVVSGGTSVNQRRGVDRHACSVEGHLRKRLELKKLLKKGLG